MRLSSGGRGVAWCAATLVLTAGCLSGGSPAQDPSVEIMYGFVLDQSSAFQASLSEWAAAEGIQIKYTPTRDFAKLIRGRASGENPPDIAIFPQPGLALELGRTGRLADLTDVLDVPALREQTVPGVISAATDADGRVFAAPISLNVKSLVWYPKPEFEAAGYEVPTTQAELLTLTDLIRERATSPWCIGLADGRSTGWVATDWVEDYVLRLGGTQTYDAWVRHEIPFDHPNIKAAAGAVADIWFIDGNVFGGREAIAETQVLDAASPMFTDPPQCFLHRQASFLAQPGRLPPDVLVDLDNRVGIFPFPPARAGDGQPIVGGGDLAALFNRDDEAARRVIRHLASADFKGWPDQGGYLSPHKNYDLSRQPNATMRDIARIAYSATVFRFDASDQMPGEVGTGSFWRGSVEWASGRKGLDEFLRDVDLSWPRP